MCVPIILALERQRLEDPWASVASQSIENSRLRFSERPVSKRYHGLEDGSVVRTPAALQKTWLLSELIMEVDSRSSSLPGAGWRHLRTHL